tara:strand:+ start:3444 stop:3716 length:273 start_codon:yes stop_codon:yes gene_type:complete
MGNQELFDLIVETFDGVVVDDYGWEHYKVKGKEYDIRFDPSRIEWSCDCKAFTYRHRWGKRYCKHIIEVQDRKFKQRVAEADGRAGARVV